MPKAFDTWQVFPHKPIEKLAPNLWRVEGDIPGANGTRVMTIAKLRDGSLLIHNGIALEEPLMAEVEAFGKPSYLIVPNGFHRLDAKVYKERYPGVRVLCPKAARKKVEQVVAVDGSYAEGPKDDDVSLAHIDGTGEREGIVQIKSPDGTTIVFNDCVNNVPKMGGLFGFLLAPTGKPSIPRIAKWMIVKDKETFRSKLGGLAVIPDLKRIILSHGAMLTDGAGDKLRAVAAEM
jgi:hypothetical protein